jgi:DNA-binding MurR/RpiR family transcriptional regulator
MSVSQTLQSCLAEMRPSEAEVTRRLLRDLGLVAEKSLRDVAAVCRTSDATVVRACRAAGFDGFQDLKYHVLRELTGGGELQPVLNGESHYGSDIAASVAAADAALEDAARLLSGASRVALAGVGASYGIALVLTDVLFTMRKQALPVHDAQMASFALTPPVTGLVLLAISHSGETQFPLRAVREAKKAGVKSIGLTNEPGSELARAVDVLLPTQTVERPAGSFAIAPRICQLAVLDRVLMRVQERGLARKRTKGTKR